MFQDLTVIVACRNEEASIEQCISRILRSCPNAALVVVDGGSDRTEELVAELTREHKTVRYIRNVDDRGKGHAIRVGTRAATTQFIAQLDADLQFLPEELPVLFERLREDRIDMILGSRFLLSSRRMEGSTPAIRRIGNYAINAYASILFGTRFTDLLAGVKVWRAKVTNAFELESDSYSYEAELALKAFALGFRVQEWPVTTEPRRTGKSSVHIFSVGRKLLRDIFCF